MAEFRTAKRSLIVVALLLPLLYSCREREEGGFEEANGPTHTAEGFTLTETVSGQRVWVLKAERALGYEDEGVIKIHGVTLDFYREGGGHYSTLTSEEGVVHTSTNDMEAFGNVVVVSNEGRLETSKLNWVAKDGKIRTDDRVRITKAETVITGRGLESDPSLEHIKIAEEFEAYSKDIEE